MRWETSKEDKGRIEGTRKTAAQESLKMIGGGRNEYCFSDGPKDRKRKGMGGGPESSRLNGQQGKS